MRSVRHFASIALAVITVVVTPILLPGTSLAQSAAFEEQALAILKAAYPADGPGGAAIVMRGGRVVWSGGHGLADIATGEPITPDTVFRVGSITKQFTAAAILQLVAEGRLSLDDPVLRFFPDWPQPGARATVRQLLNHTSGLPEFTRVPGFMRSEATMRPVTTADLLTVIRSRPSVSEPGQRWEYNNSGYVVLGAIIEQVTGKLWHEAVTEQMTRPLGLRTIAYGPAVEGDPAGALPYSAESGMFRPARGVHLSVGHAAGALVGSVNDLAKWARALHHGDVVGPELYRQMISPAPLAGGKTGPYGFGMHLIEWRGRPAMRHGGAAAGVDTGSAYIPSEDLFVAVFANSDDLPVDASIVTQRLAALALGEPLPNLVRTEVPLAEIKALFGTYRMDEGPELSFFEQAGKVYVSRGGGEAEAFAAGEDRFFFGPNSPRWYRFVRQANGAHAVEVHVIDRGEPLRGIRAGPPPAAIAVASQVLRSYVGTYATEGPVLTIALGENGGLTLAAGRESPQPLRPVSQTEFRAEGSPLHITFHPENGKVDRLTLNFGPHEFHGSRTSPP